MDHQAPGPGEGGELPLKFGPAASRAPVCCRRRSVLPTSLRCALRLLPRSVITIFSPVRIGCWLR